MDEAVERAKAYISGALGAMLDLGKGRGPMNHAFAITGEYAREAVLRPDDSTARHGKEEVR